MSERGEQVQKLLVSLAKHGDLIAEAFEGAVSGGDKARNAGIEALFAVGALKPYDEDSYRLNPRLREFFADHFASYHALQALREVTGTMRQANDQWLELRRLHEAGIAKDAERLYAAMEESVVDMAYSIDHNLTMLHSLLSTQYGNVDDLGSKLRQNRYYARQVERFLREVERIDGFAERTADEAIAAGLPSVRQLVTRRLRARCLNWTSQIKDAQAAISKRLFEARLMEARLKRLARFGLWLTRHKTASGWEIPVDGDISSALIRPERTDVRTQPDVGDTDPVILDGLLTAAAKLPRQLVTAAAPADPGPQMLIEDDGAESAEPVDPVRIALGEMIEAVLQSETSVSALAWKANHPDLLGLSDEVWLFFAYMQLRGSGLRVSLVADAALEPFAINEGFHDVRALRPAEQRV